MSPSPEWNSFLNQAYQAKGPRRGHKYVNSLFHSFERRYIFWVEKQLKHAMETGNLEEMARFKELGQELEAREVEEAAFEAERKLAGLMAKADDGTRERERERGRGTPHVGAAMADPRLCVALAVFDKISALCGGVKDGIRSIKKEKLDLVKGSGGHFGHGLFEKIDANGVAEFGLVGGLRSDPRTHPGLPPRACRTARWKSKSGRPT